MHKNCTNRYLCFMPLQFSLTKDVLELYPGLRFDSFTIHIKGEVGKLKAGDRLRHAKYREFHVIIQAMPIIERKEGETKINLLKQKAKIEVKYMTGDRHSYFPRAILKERQILELLPSPFSET